MPWADSHCHVPFEGEGDADAIVAAARAADVTRLITIGTNREHSISAIETAARFDGMWATVGLHPHDAKDGAETIADLVDKPKVVAVGECGLDYHYDHSPRDAQRMAFARQVALANAHGLALVIHTRGVGRHVRRPGGRGHPERTVFHCFTGGPPEAMRCLDAGAMLSFSGIVTFKGATTCAAAACARSIACWSRPMRRSLRRCRIGARRTSRPMCRWSARRSPRPWASMSTRFRPPRGPTRRQSLGCDGRDIRKADAPPA